MKFAKYTALTLIAALSFTNIQAQEDDPILRYSPASQNLLKFNRFLINPTFSTVREDKSYINLLHRNQSVQFQDNDQTYFLSYSGRVGDRSGLGLSAYTQKLGPVSNIGILVNYAYGVKLSEKSNFTFGGNLAYYSTGLDRNSVDVIDSDDFRLNSAEDSNVLSFQPGFNISYGQFDFGVFAENLFDYNLKTDKSLTEFGDKTYSGHLQYTYPFENGSGILEGSRLMPLARVRINGQNRFASQADESQDITYGGGIILDLPKLGWLQGGYDSFYGASAGAGFNITKRLSLGYTIEKGLATDFDNLGVTHEISFAYSFTPNLTEDRVMLDADYGDRLAENKEELGKNDMAENDAIVQERMFHKDSLENDRQKDLDRRFNMVMGMVRNETDGKRPDLEKQTGADEFTATAKPNNLETRKFTNLDGVEDGYYIVANVYKEDKLMDKFRNDLNSKGVSSNYIDNPENGLKYVYLQRYDTWREALDAHKTGMSGAYTGTLWVMNVDNRYTDDTYANNVDKPKQKSAQYGSDVLQQNVVVKDRVASNDPKTKNYDMEGVGSYYYIIANVFADPKNATRFVKLLNSRGLSAGYFTYPENNWSYVYLKKHASWSNALTSYYTNLNGSYTDKIWIMQARPTYRPK